MTLRLAFVPGVAPDKWAARWRERERERLVLEPVPEREQRAVLEEGRPDRADMVLARLPVDREGLHCVPLYEEVAVVVAGRDHVVAAADEVELADLVDEQLVRPHASGWQPTAEQLDWPDMDEAEAIATVAAGTGIVLVPQSVARLHHRRDVVVRPVSDVPPTRIGLVWRIDRDDDRIQRFVGVVRGRTVNSSR
jgi:DNA-binding transcriptional LysR family regulator